MGRKDSQTLREWGRGVAGRGRESRGRPLRECGMEAAAACWDACAFTFVAAEVCLQIFSSVGLGGIFTPKSLFT